MLFSRKTPESFIDEKQLFFSEFFVVVLMVLIFNSQEIDFFDFGDFFVNFKNPRNRLFLIVLP